ncbi:MAG: tryptophan synthase subunit alpha [Chitinophagales bacterium]
MNNRITRLFEQKKENILSIYFTAGFPNLEDTTSIIQHLDEAGADLIEIGFPFSDPLADGETIQKSSQVALDNGMTVKLLFQQLENIRKHTEIPIILMGYLNPVMQYGEKAFVEKCAALGIDGLIIPDMPLSYYRNGMQSLFQANNLSNILLITPETSEQRIRLIDAQSEGFIYMVSSNSITGANKDLTHQATYFQKVNEMQLQNPRLIGFGIHDRASFANACAYSSGAIIGSAFIKHLAKYGVSKNAINKFVKSIK